MKLRKLLLSLVALIGIASTAHALSPFQTVAGVGGPMPGTSLACKTVLVSSFTATQVLAANANRMALYVTNVSSVPTTGGSRLPLVFVSSFAVTNLANSDFGSVSPGLGAPLWATEYNITQSTAPIKGPTRLDISGGSTYQGPVFAITSDGINSKVNACELNP